MDPALVLLHGFTQTRQSWRRTAQALAARYRALVPDLPGHGQAAHRTPSFDACAAYVRALAPTRTVHARRLLDGRPDRAPQRVRRSARRSSPGSCWWARARGSPTRPSAPRAAPPTTRSRSGIETLDIEAFAREWGAQPLFAGQPQRVAAGAHADRLRNTPAGLAAALRGLGTGVMEPLWDRLPALTIPVTLIVGERDEKFRALAARDARAATERDAASSIPGAGHARATRGPGAPVAAIRRCSTRSAGVLPASPSSSASA